MAVLRPAFIRTVCSLAVEERFSDVVQKAKAAVEATGVVEESDTATGEGAATEAACRRSVSDSNNY